MNGPNKPECYITLGWKGLLVTNTLAYQALDNQKAGMTRVGIHRPSYHHSLSKVVPYREGGHKD
jgi:hypothetical protein